jgi:tetratricopeptide (TPR) repeat protein
MKFSAWVLSVALLYSQGTEKPGIPPAAVRSNVTQQSTGACSPNISNVQGNVSVQFSGPGCSPLGDEDRRKLSLLLKNLPFLLDKVSQILSQGEKEIATRIDEGLEWKRKYEDLLAEWTRRGTAEDSLKTASELLKADKLTEAVSVFDSAIQDGAHAVDRQADLYFQRAKILELQRDFGAALLSYGNAYRLKPDSFGHAYDFGLLLKDQSRIAESIPLLNSALRLASESTNPAEIALAHHALGSAFLKSRKISESVTEFERAAAGYRALFRDKPEAWRFTLAVSINSLGTAHMDAHSYDKAQAAFQEAILVSDLPSSPSDVQLVAAHADAVGNLAVLRAQSRIPGDAEKLFRKAIELYELLSKASPSMFRPELAKAYGNLGGYLATVGRDGEVEALYQQSLRVRETLALENQARHGAGLAIMLQRMGSWQRSVGRHEAAEASLLKSLEQCRMLNVAYPGIYEQQHAAAAGSLANLYFAKSNFEKSLDFHQESLGIYRKLHNLSPGVPSADVARTLRNMGAAYRQARRYGEALKSYREALGYFQELSRRSPDYFTDSVAATYGNMAITYAAMDAQGEAEANYKLAILMFRDLDKQSRQKYGSSLAQQLFNMGTFLEEHNRKKESLTYFEEVLLVVEDEVKRNQFASVSLHVSTLINIGDVLISIGDGSNRSCANFLRAKEMSPTNELQSVASKLWTQHCSPGKPGATVK